MAIDFLCSGCGEAFSVPETLAGKKAKCESCGTIVQVPVPTDTVELRGGKSRRKRKPQQPQQQQAARQMQQPKQSVQAKPLQLPPAQPVPAQPIPVPAQPIQQAQPIQAQAIPQAQPAQPIAGLTQVGAPAQAPGQPVPVAAPYQPTKPSSGGLSVGAWVGIGGGAFAAVVVVVVIAVMMMGGKKDEVAQNDDSSSTSTTASDENNEAGSSSSSKSSDTDNKQTTAKKSTAPKKKKEPPRMGFGSNNKQSSSSGTSGTNSTTTNQSSTSTPKSNTTTTSSKSSIPSPPVKLPKNFSDALKRARERAAKIDAEDAKRERELEDEEKKGKGPGLASGPTLAAWDAKPDPSPVKLEFATGKLAINLEKFQQVYFPANPSRFVMVTYRDGKNYIWATFDLNLPQSTKKANPSGKPIQGTDPPHLRKVAVSADGKYMASKVRESGNEAFRVWSFESGSVFRDIEIDKKNRSDDIYFAGVNKIVTTATPESGKMRVDVWNLSNGEKDRSITLGKDRKTPFLRNTLAFSHGGKYLVAIVAQKLKVVDVASGQVVGEAPLPRGVSSCHGMKFSNNGEKVAGLFRGDSTAYLAIWDFRNGDVLVDHEYDDSLPSRSYDGPVLDWMPDDSGLIYKGFILADVKTRLEVWNFPKTTNDARKVVVRGEKMEMLLVLKQRSTNFLTTAKLPTADIQKTVQTVRTTGSLLDANLPPSTTPNLISARQLSVPSGNIAWSAKPTDAGEPALITTRDVVLVDEKAWPKALRFSPPHSGKAVVYFAPPTTRKRSGRRTAQIQRMHSVNLANGRASGALDMPSIYELIDVSPSGNRALVGIKAKRGRGHSRVDVVSFEPKKHVAAWRPYEAETEAKKSRWSSIKTSVWSKLVSEDLVLTINGKGKLIAWKLPSCEAAYVIEEFGKPLAISPQGRYFVGSKNNKLYIFESATGDCKGELEAPSVTAKGVRAAFHPRGLRLCGFVRGNLDSECVLWDLQTGKIERQFPLPSFVTSFSYSSSLTSSFYGSIGWRGDNHILTDRGYLVNLKKQCLVWKYELRNYRVRGPIESYGPQHLQMARNNHTGPYLLSQVDMPSDAIRRGEEFATLQDQLVLYPGATVRLDVRITAGAGRISESAVRSAFESKLKERGIQIDSAASVTLIVTTKQGTTGTTIEVTKSRFPFGGGFDPFGYRRKPTPGAKTFSQKQMTCVLTLMEGQKVLWTRSAVVAMRSYGAVKKETAEQDLTKEMNDGFSGMMTSGSALDRYLSTFVFKDQNILLENRRSVITDKGESEYIKPDPSKKPTRPTRPGRPGFRRSPFSPFGGRRPNFPRSPFR